MEHKLYFSIASLLVVIVIWRLCGRFAGLGLAVTWAVNTALLLFLG